MRRWNSVGWLDGDRRDKWKTEWETRFGGQVNIRSMQNKEFHKRWWFGSFTNKNKISKLCGDTG